MPECRHRRLYNLEPPMTMTLGFYPDSHDSYCSFKLLHHIYFCTMRWLHHFCVALTVTRKFRLCLQPRGLLRVQSLHLPQRAWLGVFCIKNDSTDTQKMQVPQPPSWQLQGRSSSGNIQHMAVWFLSASTKSRHAQFRPRPLTEVRLGMAPSSMAMARS